VHFHDDPGVPSRSAASVTVAPLACAACRFGAGKAGNPVAGQQRLLACVTSGGNRPPEAAELPSPPAALGARIRVSGPGGCFRFFTCVVHAPDAGQETRHVASRVSRVT